MTDEPLGSDRVEWPLIGPAPHGVVRPEPVADLDWEPERASRLGEGVLDVWRVFLSDLKDLPVSRNRPRSAVAASVLRDVPEEPLSTDEVVAHLRNLVLGDSTYSGHPRFMAYVTGAGTVPSAAAALLAAAINQNAGAWRLSPAATEIELHLMSWLAGVLGMPAGAGGLVTPGGAIATLVALKVARDQRAGWDVRRDGIAAGPRLRIYASTEVHAVVGRAADMLGLGSEGLRLMPVDKSQRMDVVTLRDAIAGDRQNGCRPLAVVGSAGTVSTGAIDALNDLADLCAEQGIWFHVDACYGGAAALAPELKPLLTGIGRADSVAIDAHKWLYVPLTAGCLILRDPALLESSFKVAASYQFEEGGLERGPDLRYRGLQFSRSFEALKIWIALLAHGRAAYARRIAHDAELAHYLAARVEGLPWFEMMAPVTLSIACFRYAPADLDDRQDRDKYLDLLNQRLMTAIQLDGRVYCSNAIVDGRFALRACIVNFRTEAEDVEALLSVATELGRDLDRELRSAGTSAAQTVAP